MPSIPPDRVAPPPSRTPSLIPPWRDGEYARDENRCQVTLGLGDDPEQLQTLTQELMSAFGPGDALWEKQVEDLAWLYWRRERLERTQAGLRRRALQGIEDWQHRRRQEMARVTFAESCSSEVRILLLTGGLNRRIVEH